MLQWTQETSSILDPKAHKIQPIWPELFAASSADCFWNSAGLPFQNPCKTFHLRFQGPFFRGPQVLLFPMLFRANPKFSFDPIPEIRPSVPWRLEALTSERLPWYDPPVSLRKSIQHHHPRNSNRIINSMMIESNSFIFHLHFSRINLWIRRQTPCLYPYWVSLPYYNHRSTVRRVKTKHHSCEESSFAANRSIFRSILHGIYNPNETMHYHVLFSSLQPPPINYWKHKQQSECHRWRHRNRRWEYTPSCPVLLLHLVLLLRLHCFTYTALEFLKTRMVLALCKFHFDTYLLLTEQVKCNQINNE